MRATCGSPCCGGGGGANGVNVTTAFSPFSPMIEGESDKNDENEWTKIRFCGGGGAPGTYSANPFK